MVEDPVFEVKFALELGPESAYFIDNKNKQAKQWSTKYSNYSLGIPWSELGEWLPVPFSHQGYGAMTGIRSLVRLAGHRKMSLLLPKAAATKSTLLQRMKEGGKKGFISLLSSKRDALENALFKL